MQLSIERNAFLKALSHGQSVVEKRTTLPILSHIFLDADGSKVKMTSTDLELSMVESVDAHVQTPGKTTVSAHLLYDIVRKMHDGAQVSMTLDPANNTLLIASGKSEFRLPCLPAEDFPAIHTENLPHAFKLSAVILRQMIEKTKFAMSNEETRYFLNGIYLHVAEDQSLKVVATDGHRLAQVTAKAPEGAAGMPGVIISRKTVNELSKVLAEAGEEEIQVSLSTTQVSFKLGHAYLTSRLIDGKYPAYQEAIPKGNDKILHMHVKEFSKAVDRVATISTDRFSGIKVSFEDGRLTLSANNETTGAAHEELEVDYNGETVGIGFNSKYLLDIAQHIDGEEAQVTFSNSGTAVTIKSTNDNDALYVLMPMRV